MQTFLPYADFMQCAKVLDHNRLGKQRAECIQIYTAISYPHYGWQTHPAVKMWRGYEKALLEYATCICYEWKYNRAKRDFVYYEVQAKQAKLNGPIVYPPWLGNERLHSSHRAALLHKSLLHYQQYDWKEKPELNYFWPV